jgi:hypothetical protein
MVKGDSERGHDEQELKVTDRRLFTPDGALRQDARIEAEAQDARAEEGDREAREQSRPAGAGFERRPVEEPQGVDFTMLINAMGEPALLFLGEIQHPDTGRPEIDLERARIQIDMLDLLRVKCRGNLTMDEEGLLDRILYQLRMLYVARANRKGA